MCDICKSDVPLAYENPERVHAIWVRAEERRADAKFLRGRSVSFVEKYVADKKSDKQRASIEAAKLRHRKDKDLHQKNERAMLAPRIFMIILILFFSYDWWVRLAPLRDEFNHDALLRQRAREAERHYWERIEAKRQRIYNIYNERQLLQRNVSNEG